MTSSGNSATLTKSRLISAFLDFSALDKCMSHQHLHRLGHFAVLLSRMSSASGLATIIGIH